MAIAALQGTALHEQHEADSRTVERSERFERVDSPGVHDGSLPLPFRSSRPPFSSLTKYYLHIQGTLDSLGPANRLSPRIQGTLDSLLPADRLSPRIQGTLGSLLPADRLFPRIQGTLGSLLPANRLIQLLREGAIESESIRTASRRRSEHQLAALRQPRRCSSAQRLSA
ncbi:hypothetical protein B8V81_3026 [Paenibacillus pasadenensis]|uniref:Uncharacterized protein n=1 Tax=Paenibacillus pasadenensis TaxID=217090 RepID=A0A2N5N2P0_9BACL|nr:hypothetical protein B8V81_3026 [Paenibacillus pasadenensis]